MATKSQSIGDGQKIVTSYGRDDSSHKLPSTMGGSMGGSDTNLAHSLSGAGAVLQTPSPKKNGFK